MILISVIVGGYALLGVLLTWRAERWTPRKLPPDLATPRVAAIVAARNEAEDLPRCLAALASQDFPAGRLEIIVASDHSTDATEQVVATFAATSAAHIRCVRVPDPVGHLRGKAQALHTAIGLTGADIFMITDADCAPPPTWVGATVARFADPQVGIVCGLSWMGTRRGRWFDGAQSVDWAYGVSALSALAEAGWPASGMGNNMGVRRAAYEAVGGYPALPFSVTEDFTLLQAVSEQTTFRLRYPPLAETTVPTLPVDGFGAAYRQRQRWARGGLVGGAPIVATYSALFVVHLAALVGFFVEPMLAAGLLVAKVGGETLLIRATARRVGASFRWRDVPGFVLFQFCYMLTLPIAMMVSPTTRWKDRTL